MRVKLRTNLRDFVYRDDDRLSAFKAYNRFLAKALPDDDLRYFSNVAARVSLENAIWVFTRHGLNLKYAAHRRRYI
jgi:hypothetical protein